MADALLVLNAGSSSLKFSLFAAGPLDLRLHGEIEHIGSAAHFVAHLGAGSSLCALSAGRSIATTMGFTALDGVPMATRCGNLDPGVVLYMLQELGMSPSEVENVLYNQSGLAGVSGISGDMRDLADSSSPHAKAAIDLYVYRIGREIGSLAAALGGLDALVFTGGIGDITLQSAPGFVPPPRGSVSKSTHQRMPPPGLESVGRPAALPLGSWLPMRNRSSPSTLYTP